MSVTEKVVVKDPQGLHLRAAVALILVTRKYKSQVTLKHGWKKASAQSVLGILNLGAFGGTELEITSEGDDAGEALAEIRSFLESPKIEI